MPLQEASNNAIESLFWSLRNLHIHLILIFRDSKYLHAQADQPIGKIIASLWVLYKRARKKTPSLNTADQSVKVKDRDDFLIHLIDRISP